MKIYDISMEISEDMKVYSENEKVKFAEIYSIEKGDPVNLTRLSLTGHTGTHADTPLHFVSKGEDCTNIALDKFYGPAKLIDLSHIEGDVSAAVLKALDICEGDILLLCIADKIILSEAASYLAEKKIKTIGVNTLSVDAAGSDTWPAHHILLGAGIAIIEGLVLEGVPQGTYELSALPLKIRNGNGSPVRAVLSDKRRLELVIFDMDGVMIDTEPASKQGWITALEKYGLDLDEGLFIQMQGRNIQTTRQIMMQYFGEAFDFDGVLKRRSLYMEEYIAKEGLKTKPGLQQMLDKLDELSIKKCIATSTERESMERKLGDLGLMDRFDGFVTGDMVKEGKPNPAIFLEAAKMMGVKPENCIVLEDSLSGIGAAYSAGMRPIMIPDLTEPDLAARSRIFAKCKTLSEAALLTEGLAKS